MNMIKMFNAITGTPKLFHWTDHTLTQIAAVTSLRTRPSSPIYLCITACIILIEKCYMYLMQDRRQKQGTDECNVIN